MKKLLLAILVVVFAISSCSIEKRVHQKGFNIEWNNNLGSLKKDKKEKQDYVSSVAEEEINVVSNKTTKVPSANNNNSVISVDGVTLNESNDASVFVEYITTNEVDSPESTVANNTKIGKVNKAIIASNASSSKEVASNKTMNSTKSVKKALKNDVPTGLLYLLCFLMPWLAVGFATDWDIKTVVINILWTFLCGIPGIIHAIIIVGRNS